MRRRAIVTTLFTALLAMSLSGLGVGVLQAQMVLFGPTTYTRTAGAPNQFTDTFTLPAGHDRPVYHPHRQWQCGRDQAGVLWDHQNERQPDCRA